jgi:hypothetical protein
MFIGENLYLYGEIVVEVVLYNIARWKERFLGC